MLTIVPKQADLKSVDIVEPRTSIGTHNSNTMVIQSASVSEFHAEFHLQNDKIVLIDLGSESGTTINGETVSGRVKVKHNDVLKVGDVELKLIDPEQKPDSKSTEVRSITSGWLLVGKPDSLLPGELPIEGVMTVGRDKDCDFSIPVSHISRRHAQFEITGGSLKVKDLGSTNGTTVNGETITETELNPGDIICFDTEEFLILGPVKEEPATENKTRLRDVVTQVKKVEDVQPGIVEDDYKVISEGATVVERVWKESGAKAANKTVVMSPVQVDAGGKTQAIPVIDKKLMASLECKTSPMSGTKFDLLKSINTVGRTGNNDIEINEASVSSKHAQIIYKNGSWVIQDLDSYNGVFVNNKKCKSKKLKNGDAINFGRVQLVFSNKTASDVSNSVKKVLSGIKVPVLLVKTIVLLVVVSVISEFAYNYISKLEFDNDFELHLAWENISADRVNPSRPAVFDINNDGIDDVVITSENGMVEIIDGGNGFKLSSFDSGINLYSSPLLIDVGADNTMDIVNVSSDGQVLAFDINGNQLWSNTDVQGQLFVAQSVAVKINEDNVKDIVLPTEKNGIVILDGNTGKQYMQLDQIQGKITTQPIVRDINRDGVTDIVAITDTNQIVAFSIQNAIIRKLWEVNIPPVLTAALKFGEIKNHGVIFVATQNSGVLALNSYTGGKIWQSKIDGLLFSEPVLVDTDGDKINDAVVQTTYSGNVVALDTTKGNQLWDITLPNKIQVKPVVINNNTNDSDKLLFADTEGMIHTVKIENGYVSNSKKINIADRFVVSPVLRHGKLNAAPSLILTSQNGNVSLFRTGTDNK